MLMEETNNPNAVYSFYLISYKAFAKSGQIEEGHYEVGFLSNWKPFHSNAVAELLAQKLEKQKVIITSVFDLGSHPQSSIENLKQQGEQELKRLQEARRQHERT